MTYGCLFDIKRYAIHDGPGIRVTLFFQGCPMTCWWCHNPEGIRAIPHGADSEYNPVKIIRKMSIEEILREIEKDILFFDESGGGATFSGGEPLIQNQFLFEILCECKKREIHTALDTTGYAPSEIVRSIMDHVDLFLYDLKLMDEAQHEKYTGVSNRIILENLEMLAAEGKEIIIRFPLIPGISDAGGNLSRMTEYLSSLKNIRTIHILPFHKTAQRKYKHLHLEDKVKDIQPPTPDQLDAVQRRFEQEGYRVHIGG
ncbi:MAG: glycyl-radical enzyme activating protein [Candidatus Omnitrophica bacterium]|nr:glycyl-radical enzyme activating protein [Candidatus Omnitrophota bacterium]